MSAFNASRPAKPTESPHVHTVVRVRGSTSEYRSRLHSRTRGKFSKISFSGLFAEYAVCVRHDQSVDFWRQTVRDGSVFADRLGGLPGDPLTRNARRFDCCSPPRRPYRGTVYPGCATVLCTHCGAGGTRRARCVHRNHGAVAAVWQSFTRPLLLVSVKPSLSRTIRYRVSTTRSACKKKRKEKIFPIYRVHSIRGTHHAFRLSKLVRCFFFFQCHVFSKLNGSIAQHGYKKCCRPALCLTGRAQLKSHTAHVNQKTVHFIKFPRVWIVKCGQKIASFLYNTVVTKTQEQRDASVYESKITSRVSIAPKNQRKHITRKYGA